MQILFSVIIVFLWLIVAVLFITVRQLSKDIIALHDRLAKIEPNVSPTFCPMCGKQKFIPNRCDRCGHEDQPTQGTPT